MRCISNTNKMEIDIHRIDQNIRELSKSQQQQIATLSSKRSELHTVLEEDEKQLNKLSPHIVKDIQLQIQDCDHAMKTLEHKLMLIDFYTMEVMELLHVRLDAQPRKISFMKRDRAVSANHVTEQFLTLLRKYDLFDDIVHELEITSAAKVVREKVICSYCKSNDLIYYCDMNMLICETCGNQQEKAMKTVSFKDISRVNMSNKYTYERRIHFKDCINQYQGKQNATIDERVYRDVEEQLHRHDLLLGDVSTSRRQRFERISKDHILMFLKETGHTKHYEDIVLIYRTMTEKKVDDISHLEAHLMEDFDKISDLYDKKYKMERRIDRKSFINTQYILFQLLKRHKYPCKKEDFNMLKTLDRQSFHDEIVRDLFEQLNFNFTPIF